MAVEVHATWPRDTIANTRTNADALQTGILSDNADTNTTTNNQESFTHINNAGTLILVEPYYKTINKSSGAETYLDFEFKDGYLQGDLHVGNKVEHLGDTDTFLSFTTDAANITVGNVAILDITEDDTQDKVVFNEAGADIDFRIEGTGAANAFFVQGSDGKVGFGTAAPANMVDIYVAASGATATAAYDELVIQSSASCGLSILTTEAADKYVGIELKTNNSDVIKMYGNSGAGTGYAYLEAASNFEIKAGEMFDLKVSTVNLMSSDGGSVTFNNGNIDLDIIFKGDTAEVCRIDAGTDTLLFPDNKKIALSVDGEIYSDGTDTRIKSNTKLLLDAPGGDVWANTRLTTGSLTFVDPSCSVLCAQATTEQACFAYSTTKYSGIKTTSGGAMQFSAYDAETFEFTYGWFSANKLSVFVGDSGLVTLTPSGTHIILPDNKKLGFGDTTTPDAEIYWNATNFIIKGAFPTSDPGVAGTVWADNTVLKVSAGA